MPIQFGVLLYEWAPNSHHWELGAYSGYCRHTTIIIESETRLWGLVALYYQVVLKQ